MSLQFIYFSSDCCPYAYHWQVRTYVVYTLYSCICMIIHCLCVCWGRHYLEFLISDQVVPYNMTIFQAVRQFAVVSVWNVHNIDTALVWSKTRNWRHFSISCVLLHHFISYSRNIQDTWTLSFGETKFWTFSFGETQNVEPFLLGKHKILNPFIWGNTKLQKCMQASVMRTHLQNNEMISLSLFLPGSVSGTGIWRRGNATGKTRNMDQNSHHSVRFTHTHTRKLILRRWSQSNMQLSQQQVA